MTATVAAFSDSTDISGELNFNLSALPIYIYTLLKPSELADPSYSPDGTTLVFTQHIRANYIISTATVEATPTVETLYTSPYPIQDPTYSEDGFFILFGEELTLPSDDFPYGKWRIRYMNSDGSDVVTILDDGNANLHPCWVTPSQIAFQWWQYGATPSSVFHISLIDLAGRGRTDLGEGEYPRLVRV